MRRHSTYALLLVTTLPLYAYAQNSVTLYGVVDLGMLYTNNVNGKSQIQMKSGGQKGGRFGLIGEEGLGAQTKAVFRLENGFNAATGALGQNGALFGRAAYVGLANDTYGTVTLGRQNQSTYTVITGLLQLPAGGTWASTGGGYGTHVGDIDNLDGANVINNSIKYQSPKIAGFTAVGLYSFGGKPGSVSQNGIYDIALGYENGPIAAGVGYGFARNPNFSLWGSKPNDSQTGSNISNVIFSGYASASSNQIFVAGAGYTFGPARLSLVYSNVQFSGLGSVGGVTTGTAATYRGEAVFNTGEVNVTYQITPALFWGNAYSYTKDSGANDSGGAHYQLFVSSMIYSLSKRTAVYGLVAYQRANGTNSLGKPAVAQIGGITSPSSNNHQDLAVAGLIHRF